MRKSILILVLMSLLVSGCETLRFAPDQVQRQNAWLHDRTAELTAETARDENASEQLQTLADLSETQAHAMTAYFGLPADLPPADSASVILDGTAASIAAAANAQASQRPDGWTVADSALELGIGICAILGGAYGVRAASFLKKAREKSDALREVIRGNELFKQSNPEAATAFKTAHMAQSPGTKQLVTQMKA